MVVKSFKTQFNYYLMLLNNIVQVLKRIQTNSPHDIYARLHIPNKVSIIIEQNDNTKLAILTDEILYDLKFREKSLQWNYKVSPPNFFVALLPCSEEDITITLETYGYLYYILHILSAKFEKKYSDIILKYILKSVAKKSLSIFISVIDPNYEDEGISISITSSEIEIKYKYQSSAVKTISVFKFELENKQILARVHIKILDRYSINIDEYSEELEFLREVIQELKLSKNPFACTTYIQEDPDSHYYGIIIPQKIYTLEEIHAVFENITQIVNALED